MTRAFDTETFRQVCFCFCFPPWFIILRCISGRFNSVEWEPMNQRRINDGWREKRRVRGKTKVIKVIIRYFRPLSHIHTEYPSVSTKRVNSITGIRATSVLSPFHTAFSSRASVTGRSHTIRNPSSVLHCPIGVFAGKLNAPLLCVLMGQS